MSYKIVEKDICRCIESYYRKKYSNLNFLDNTKTKCSPIPGDGCKPPKPPINDNSCFANLQYSATSGGVEILRPLNSTAIALLDPNVATLVCCSTPSGWTTDGNSITIPENCQGCYQIEYSLSARITNYLQQETIPSTIIISICLRQPDNTLVPLTNAPTKRYDQIDSLSLDIDLQLKAQICLEDGQQLVPCISANETELDVVGNISITWLSLKLTRLNDCPVVPQ